MPLPSALLDQIKMGRAVLFLGSGALVGSNLPGKEIPLGNGLRDLLSDQFLDGEYKEESLAHVAALATSQHSLTSVQDYIRDYFSVLEPADFHLKIPCFSWRAIFTTNYDRLVETCYERVDKRAQNIVTVLSNSDPLDETRVTNDKIPLVKLHGCITRTHDESLPLILTVDQYAESLENRKRLFRHLYELAYENTIIFVGHSLQDSNLRAVLLELERESRHGKRHYLLKPGIKQAEIEYWSEKRITGLDIDFEKFIFELDKCVTDTDKVLALVRPSSTHPIKSRFTVHDEPSEELVRFLTDDAEFVYEGSPVEPVSAQEFYRGGGRGWSPIEESLAIGRRIENALFENIVSKPEAERSVTTELHVVKGEAGSGKTVLLRKLAWESKALGLGVFIWLRPKAFPDVDVIQELAYKTKERVFLVWDDAASSAHEMARFITNARRKKIPVSVITAERFSEWNTRCDVLDELSTDEYQLHYLSESEIDALLENLEKNDSLGPNLTTKAPEERRIELKEVHGRQLLVALHEATMGEPFEDIIHSEYSNIIPEAAQRIYLTVCTLNRLRVPVRAGLISRIHDVSFEEFQSKFLKPLEKVVLCEGSGAADIHYTARHPEIAQIVFERVLVDNIDRYHEYVRILAKLNISYSSDYSSFRSLVRARALHDLFPSYEDVKNIYDIALDEVGADPYLLQQMANYERIRPNGNLDRALELLTEAREKAPKDSSIPHTLAVVWRDKANAAEDPGRRIRYRKESRAYLDESAVKYGESEYISTTKIELSLDNIVDMLADNDSTEIVVNEAIRSVQGEITECKRKFSSRGHLHVLDARLAELLQDREAVVQALERSFEENDRDPYTAIRVATIHRDNGHLEKADQVLKLALERRRSDHKLNFAYAELLRSEGRVNSEELMYYYRRGYTPGDQNYSAQFWYARYASQSTDQSIQNKAKEIFVALRSARLPHKSRVEIRDKDGGLEAPAVHHGTLQAKKSSYCFVAVDGSGESLFCPAVHVLDDLWEAIEEGDRLKFQIGYSYSGALGCEIQPE